MDAQTICSGAGHQRQQFFAGCRDLSTLTVDELTLPLRNVTAPVGAWEDASYNFVITP